MIILDTSTVYYISGKSNSAKCDVKKVISYAKNGDSYISSITASEILCHYKNKANYVRRIFSSLRYNNVKMIYHPLLPYYKDNNITIKDLSYINQNDLINLVNKSISKKVDFESTYAFSMFFIVFASTLCFSLPDTQKSYGVLSILLKAWRNQNIDECKEFFKKSFEYGYKTNDCEAIIKNNFEYMLFEHLSLYKTYAIEIMNNIDTNSINEILDNINFIKFSKVFQRKVQRLGNTSQYVKWLAGEYKKNEGTAAYLSFKTYMYDLIKSVFDRKTGVSHESMYKYFIDISERILERGGLYLKNDILMGLFYNLCI